MSIKQRTANMGLTKAAVQCFQSVPVQGSSDIFNVKIATFANLQTALARGMTTRTTQLKKKTLNDEGINRTYVIYNVGQYGPSRLKTKIYKF